jgi:L-alanine-DL-glutamate epimerase-like enolase superfamily enzyme
MTGWRRMFVKVYTDEGIVGVGEGGNWGFRESMVGAIHRMEEPLLGQDPLRIEYLDSELYSRFKFGGITGCKKAAAIAESHYVNVIPHIATGSICYAASLHLAAAIPNFEVMEMCPAPGEWPKIQQEIKTPFVIENGYMLLPEGPGLGVELRDDILETAPYHERRWDLSYNEYK